MNDNFELLEDQMGPDHQLREKHRAWGCLVLAGFVVGLVCFGGCIALFIITALRGSWWN